MFIGKVILYHIALITLTLCAQVSAGPGTYAHYTFSNVPESSSSSDMQVDHIW